MRATFIRGMTEIGAANSLGTTAALQYITIRRNKVKRMAVPITLLASLLFIAATPRVNSEQKIQHGKYLVHHVAMCVQCHTPRDENGELLEDELLQGAPLPVKSPFQYVHWAFQTPKLAGLPGGFSEEDLITLLRTGKRPDGHSPQPPMPPFRMTEEDAAAVAAYLKSL